MLTDFFTSRARFFLIAGDAGVTCVARHVARARAPFFAGWQDRGAQKHLGELLAHYRRAPVTFYADNLAQDVRVETLPALNIFDRAKLARRRLKQAFPQARYSANKLLSRTQVLFAGLSDNALLANWFERIKPRLPTIGLLPLECAPLIARLAPESADGWILFLCRTRTGGFRQIIMREGQILFSRLTPDLSPHADAGEIASKVTRDITSSLGY